MKTISLLLALILLLIFAGQAQAAKVTSEQRSSAKALFRFMNQANKVYRSNTTGAEKANAAASQILSQCTPALQAVNSLGPVTQANLQVGYQLNEIFHHSVIGGSSSATTIEANNIIEDGMSDRFGFLPSSLQQVYYRYSLYSSSWQGADLSPEEYCDQISAWQANNFTRATMPRILRSNRAAYQALQSGGDQFMNSYRTLTRWANKLKIKDYDFSYFVDGYGPDIYGSCDSIDCAKVDAYLNQVSMAVVSDPDKITRSDAGATVPVTIAILRDQPATLKMRILGPSFVTKPTRRPKPLKEVCSQTKQVSVSGEYQMECLIPAKYLSKTKATPFELDLSYDAGSDKTQEGYGNFLEIQPQ